MNKFKGKKGKGLLCLLMAAILLFGAMASAPGAGGPGQDNAESSLSIGDGASRETSGSPLSLITGDKGEPAPRSRAAVSYEAVIDLSTTTSGGPGYTVTGNAPAYSNPAWPAAMVDRTLQFSTAANGKVYQIIQSGVRSNPPDSNAPKQDTSIFGHIMIPDGVDVTLVFSGIDINSGTEVELIGSAQARLLIEGTNYVRSRIAAPLHTSLTIDSLSGDDASDRLIMPGTPGATGYHARIGGTGAIPGSTPSVAAGAITINGATITITAATTGAGIGGGGGAIGTGYSAGSNGGVITINGGVVSITQYGSGSAAGSGIGGAAIGGGGGNNSDGAGGGDINIAGGKINVTQHTRGAAIGGGAFGTAGHINISGGDLTAQAIDLSGVGVGSAIGSAAGSNCPGTGSIVISGGTIKAIGATTGIGRVHGNYGPSLDITISGGTIYAKGTKGPGIGYWSASYGDTIAITGGTVVADSEIMTGIGGDDSTNLRLDAAANVRAYSGTGSSSFAAISAKSNLGNGYFVNARLNAAISSAGDTRLDVYAKGGNATLKTLTLPKNYRCFAYSTDATALRTDSVYAYNGSSYIGDIVRLSDNSPDIYSIIALNGYNSHNANASNGVLPVKLRSGSMVTVTYNANGGGGADYIHTTGVTVGPTTVALKTLPETGFTAPTTGASKFLGWNTAANGSGAFYASGQAGVTIAGSITLYAQWGDRYIVTKNSNNALIGHYHYLSDAVSNCGPYASDGWHTITATENDPDVTFTNHASAIVFPADKKIILTSDNNGPYTLTQTQNKRHFDVAGELTMENITIDVSGVGGGVAVKNILNLESGAVIQNCNGVQALGGGVYLYKDASTAGVLNMQGGAIKNNKSTGPGPLNAGGGVYVSGGTTFTMSGGTISGNVANSTGQNAGVGFGGGVFVDDGIFTMSGGTISDNIASTSGKGDGGGVYMAGGIATLSNGKITGNTTTTLDKTLGNGGGLWVSTTSALHVTGPVEISNNKAPNGDGGGIFDENCDYASPAAVASYANISLDASVNMYGNKAAERSAPPSNASDFMTRPSDRFDGALLDNDDINYHNPNYLIRYVANNGTEQSDFTQDSGTSAGFATLNTVLLAATGFQAPEDLVFQGWNTAADGSGTHYDAGAPLVISSSIVLYAQWAPLTTTLTISKMVARDYGDRTKDFTFTLTFVNDSGTALAADTSFDYTGSVVAGASATAPQDGVLTLDRDGKTTFTLKHGQAITLTEIAGNIKVRVVENSGILYVASFKDSADSALTDSNDTGLRPLTGDTRVFDFLNTRATVPETSVRIAKSSLLLVLPAAVLALLGYGFNRKKHHRRAERAR